MPLPIGPGPLLDGLFSALATLMLGALHLLWGLLGGFAVTSPDVTLLPQVRELSTRSLLVVNTVYLLAVMAAGILVMVRETVQIRYGIADLAPRLLVGLVAANLSTPLCQGLIEAANALTQALTSEPISSNGSFEQLKATILVASAPGTTPPGFLMSAIILLLVVLTVGLLITWLVRVGLLVLLTGIAPLALACHGLPHTEPAARLWWRAILAALGIVMVQAFALHTTLRVFLSPQTNLPSLGLPADPNGTINLFIVVCLLWTVVRIPSLARRYITGGRPSTAATVIRVLLVQYATRGLTRGAGRSLGRLARVTRP
jgi:hypothetical protein